MAKSAVKEKPRRVREWEFALTLAVLAVASTLIGVAIGSYFGLQPFETAWDWLSSRPGAAVGAIPGSSDGLEVTADLLASTWVFLRDAVVLVMGIIAWFIPIAMLIAGAVFFGWSAKVILIGEKQ